MGEEPEGSVGEEPLGRGQREKVLMGYRIGTVDRRVGRGRS